MAVPVLLYGTEATGFENLEVLEGLCTQFYKITLKQPLKGELGRYPINISTKSRMTGLWQVRLYTMHLGDFFSSKVVVKYKR